jgi:hypothetical protein
MQKLLRVEISLHSALNLASPFPHYLLHAFFNAFASTSENALLHLLIYPSYEPSFHGNGYFGFRHGFPNVFDGKFKYGTTS